MTEQLQNKADIRDLTIVFPMPMKEDPGGWLIADDPSWKPISHLPGSSKRESHFNHYPNLPIRMRKLIVFSEDSIYCDGQLYKLKNPLTKLYGELGRWFDKVILSGPVKYVNKPVEGYTEERITYSPRPFYGGSVLGFFKHLPRIAIPTLRNITINVTQANLIMLHLPSPIGLVVYWQARRQRKPCCLYVVGDIRKVAAQGEKYRGVMKFIVTIAAQGFHRLTRRMARGALVFVTGSELREEFDPLAKRCVNLIPSLVSDTDIFEREDTCQSEPIQLLYVGRLVPVKGLRYLFEALRLLVDKDIKVKLQIVGDGYQQPGLAAMAEELAITKCIQFTGRVAFGPHLFRIYREADLFVLPSLSEGLPKTLLEAMASGLPIIATRVGGVPDIIRDGETGLLVEPRSPQKIAQAVEHLISDASLRQRLIRNGYAFVREHTVDKQAERMWQEIRDFFCFEA